MKKYIALFLSLLFTVSILTSCGSGSMDSAISESKSYVTGSSQMMNTSASMDYNAEYKSEESMEAETGGMGSDSSVAGKTEAQSTEIKLDLEKLVYRSNVTIETMQYAEALSKLRETISSIGGFVQYESESDNDHNWYYSDHYKTRGTLEAYISCRIPSKEYAGFMEGLNDYGKVVEKDSTVENISQRYNDTTTKIASLKIQEERLLDMLEKAVTIEDMLNIEDRLEQVRYEINSLETNIRHMDMDVAYSYVNITLTEVLEYTPDETPVKKNTFFDRLINTLADSAEGFLDFCEWALFTVIILAPYIAIAAVVLFILCKIKKKTLKELFTRKPRVKKSIEGISTKKTAEDTAAK